jgi:hypothetical protein
MIDLEEFKRKFDELVASTSPKEFEEWYEGYKAKSKFPLRNVPEETFGLSEEARAALDRVNDFAMKKESADQKQEGHYCSHTWNYGPEAMCKVQCSKCRSKQKKKEAEEAKDARITALEHMVKRLSIELNRYYNTHPTKVEGTVQLLNESKNLVP